METLKYKVIASANQYKQYCRVLEQLLSSGSKDRNTRDEIDLLTLLIEKWDADNIASIEMDPIQLVRSFMKDHNMKSVELSEILGISKGYVSDILNYKKGLSKDVIRKLSDYFNVAQEAFNRSYSLHVPENSAPGMRA